MFVFFFLWHSICLLRIYKGSFKSILDPFSHLFFLFLLNSSNVDAKPNLPLKSEKNQKVLLHCSHPRWPGPVRQCATCHRQRSIRHCAVSMHCSRHFLNITSVLDPAWYLHSLVLDTGAQQYCSRHPRHPPNVKLDSLSLTYFRSSRSHRKCGLRDNHLSGRGYFAEARSGKY